VNPLSKFRWYRRMRGGYWGQVTGGFAFNVLGNLNGRKWVRVSNWSTAPLPNGQWEFYPWAKKERGNGFCDEWYEMEPFYMVPLSSVYMEIFGTSDPENLKEVSNGWFSEIMSDPKTPKERQEFWVNRNK